MQPQSLKLVPLLTIVVCACSQATFTQDPPADAASSDAGDEDQLVSSDAHDASTSAYDVAKPAPKRVFVTSNSWNGDLKTAGLGTDGPTGADNLCNASAKAANLGGTWRAWIVTASTLATTRIEDVSPWMLLNGQVAVSSFQVLKSNSLTNAIDVTENANVVTDGHVWTGGDSNGAGPTCYDWTSGSATSMGVDGVVTSSADDWTYHENYWCNATRSLYCFEQ